MPLHGIRWIALVAAIATPRVQCLSALSGWTHAGGSSVPVYTLMDGRSFKMTTIIDRRRLCFCASSSRGKNLDWQLRGSRHDKGDSDEPSSSFSLIDALFTPTPGIADSLKVLFIPLLSLILYATFVDPSAALTTMVLFFSLRTVAIRLVLFPQLPDKPENEEEEDDDEDERNNRIIEQLQLDAFSIGISAACILIVGPDYYPLLIGASFAITALLLATSVKDIVNEEQLNEDDKLLNRWDKRFRKQKNIDDKN